MLGLVVGALLSVSQPADPPRALAIDVLDDTDAMCMTGGSLRELIGETLEQPLVEPLEGATDVARMSVNTRLGAIGRETRIEVVGARDVSRVRAITIEDERCEELLGAVALVGALLLDEIWQEERTLVVPPAPHPDPPGPDAQPASISEVSAWQAFAGVGGQASYQDLPGFAGAAVLRAEFTAPRVLGFGLAAHLWPRKRTEVSEGVGARFSAYDVGLFVCPRFVDRDRFMLGTCLGGRAGVLSAVGSGLTTSGGANRPRGFVDVGLSGRVRLGGPVWLGFGVDAAVVLVRDSFVYDEGEERLELHRAWPVVPLARITLEIRSIVKGRRGAQTEIRKAQRG